MYGPWCADGSNNVAGDREDDGWDVRILDVQGNIPYDRYGRAEMKAGKVSGSFCFLIGWAGGF